MNLSSFNRNDSIPSRLNTQIGAFFAFFFVIFGLFGNSLIIIAILRKKDLRNNIVNIFIVSLQLNDIINICFTQFLVGLSYNYIEWYRNSLLCELFVYTSIICTGALLWHHALISIHRFLVVVRNQTTSYLSMSPKVYAILSLLLARLIPTLTLLPALISRNMTTYVAKTLRCMLGNNSVNQNKIIFLINIVLPCLIVVVCFVRIFTKVRDVSRRLNKTKKKKKSKSESIVSQITNTKTSNGFTKAIVSSTGPSHTVCFSSKKAHNINREIQITKMFGVIFVVFLFGYMPYGLIRSMDKNNSLNADIYILLTILFIVSISISPIIYGLMNTQIKMQCINLLRIMFCCPKTKFRINENKFNKTLQQINMKTSYTKVMKVNEPMTKLKSMSKESVSASNKLDYSNKIIILNQLKQRSKSAPDLVLFSGENYQLVDTGSKLEKMKRNFSVKNNYSTLINNSKKKQHNGNNHQESDKAKVNSSRFRRANETFKKSFKNSIKSFFAIKDNIKSVSSLETIHKSKEDLKEIDDGGVYKGPEIK